MGQPTASHVAVSRAECIGAWKPTGGSEPSQYPQEEKAIAIPSVAASESGKDQTIQGQAGERAAPKPTQVQAVRRGMGGVVGCCSTRLPPIRGVTKHQPSRRSLERAAIAGDSPVSERLGDSLAVLPSTTGHEKPCGNPGGPSPKAKYSSATDSEPVP